LPATALVGASKRREAVVPTNESFDAAYDLGEWRELAKKAQWDSLQAYGDLLTRVVPDGWPRRLADLNVRYYEQLLKETQSLTDQWLDAVERVRPTRPSDRTTRPEADGPRQVPMSLHAKVGEVAKGSISLRNKERVETEISFLASDFTSSDGQSIRPTITVLPDRFWLGPMEERVVVIEVALEPELFPPAKQFRGSVAVRGYDNLELSLTVWSDE
jgi:hypothetical protein